MPDPNAEPDEGNRADGSAEAPFVLDLPAPTTSWNDLYPALAKLEQTLAALLPEHLTLRSHGGTTSRRTNFRRHLGQDQWYEAEVSRDGYPVTVTLTAPDVAVVVHAEGDRARPLAPEKSTELKARVREEFDAPWREHHAWPALMAWRFLRLPRVYRGYMPEADEPLRRLLVLLAARTLPDPVQRQTGIALADGWAGTPSELVATVRGLLNKPDGASPAP